MDRDTGCLPEEEEMDTEGQRIHEEELAWRLREDELEAQKEMERAREQV